jgi:hypothetical protein
MTSEQIFKIVASCSIAAAFLGGQPIMLVTSQQLTSRLRKKSAKHDFAEE